MTQTPPNDVAGLVELGQLSPDWEFWLKDAEKILRQNGTTTHAYKLAELRAAINGLTPAPVAHEGDDIAAQIDALYEHASNNPCTCNQDESSCRYCNAWERARHKVRTLIAALQQSQSTPGAGELVEAARDVVANYPVAAGTSKGMTDGDGPGYGSIKRLAKALAASPVRVDAGGASNRVIYLLQKSMAEMVGTLQWYADKVASCRKVTSEGNEARAELHRDGGKRARDILVSKTKAALHAAPAPEAGAIDKALEWFSGQHNLELFRKQPVYGDDDDQTDEWQVTRANGGINDREWAVIGRGETAAEALLAASENRHDG